MSQSETWASLEQMPWTHSDPGCNIFLCSQRYLVEAESERRAFV